MYLLYNHIILSSVSVSAEQWNTVFAIDNTRASNSVEGFHKESLSSQGILSDIAMCIITHAQEMYMSAL